MSELDHVPSGLMAAPTLAVVGSFSSDTDTSPAVERRLCGVNCIRT